MWQFRQLYHLKGKNKLKKRINIWIYWAPIVNGESGASVALTYSFKDKWSSFLRFRGLEKSNLNSVLPKSVYRDDIGTTFNTHERRWIIHLKLLKRKYQSNFWYASLARSVNEGKIYHLFETDSDRYEFLSIKSFSVLRETLYRIYQDKDTWKKKKEAKLVSYSSSVQFGISRILRVMVDRQTCFGISWQEFLPEGQRENYGCDPETIRNTRRDRPKLFPKILLRSNHPFLVKQKFITLSYFVITILRRINFELKFEW